MHEMRALVVPDVIVAYVFVIAVPGTGFWVWRVVVRWGIARIVPGVGWEGLGVLGAIPKLVRVIIRDAREDAGMTTED